MTALALAGRAELGAVSCSGPAGNELGRREIPRRGIADVDGTVPDAGGERSRMTVETLDERRAEGDGTPGPKLQVSLRHVGAVCVLTLRGDLCAESVSVLEAEFDRLARTPCHRVVIDVTELTALDEVGSRVLTGLSHYVQGRGGALTVVGASAAVAQALACI